jgi:ABC-type lipoprotein export system ATPase subunit
VPDLSVRNASVTFGSGAAKCRALQDVTLSFEPGSLTLLMGPSGSGKTTLLSLLGCLLTPDSGSIYLDGVEVSRLNEKQRTAIRRRKIGFIFQAFRLFRSLSAIENVTIAEEISSGEGPPQQRTTARKLLSDLGLGDKIHLKPDKLSGGEKQRVAIARALIRNPQVLLADEPTASLDSQAGRQIFEILFKLATEGKKTVVVVSHDPRWESFAHRVTQLRDGQVLEQWSANR